MLTKSGYLFDHKFWQRRRRRYEAFSACDSTQHLRSFFEARGKLTTIIDFGVCAQVWNGSSTKVVWWLKAEKVMNSL